MLTNVIISYNYMQIASKELQNKGGSLNQHSV